MFVYYYTVCYFTCIFYAIVRQISMLFIDNKDSVFCVKVDVAVLGSPSQIVLNVVSVDVKQH